MTFFQYGTVPSDEAIKTLLENEGKLKDLSDDDVKAKIKEYKNKIINQPEEQAAATVLRHNSGNFIAKDSTESNTTTYLADEASDQFTAYLKPITRNVDNSFKASDYKNKDIKYSEIGMYSGFKDGDDNWKPEVLRIQTPGNQYNHTGLTNVNTANAFVFSTPNANKYGEFRNAAANAVVNEILYACNIRLLVTTCQNSDHPSFDDSIKIIDNGIRIIKLIYSVVIPIESPNPGSTFFLLRFFILFLPPNQTFYVIRK